MQDRLGKMLAKIVNAVRLQRAAAISLREVEKHKCAVCLTSLNRAGRRLENCLRTLRHQSVPESCVDITLCDMGSTPDICDELGALAQKYRVRQVRMNLPAPEWQRSWPMNAAMRHSAPDAAFLLASDIDMIYAPNFIEWVLRCHLALPDKTFVMCEYHQLPDDTAMQRYDAAGDYYKILACAATPHVVGSGHCQSFTRAWCNEIHGYDERFRCWGYEDNDMQNRATISRFWRADMSSKTSDIHQWHETHEQRMTREGAAAVYKEALQRNDAIFKDNMKANTLVRNPGGWGLLPPTGVVIEPPPKKRL